MPTKTKESKWSRNCLECNVILYYSSEGNLKVAEKNNRLCKSCSQCGNKNHRYGKKHTEEWKKWASENRKGEKMVGMVKLQMMKHGKL